MKISENSLVFNREKKAISEGSERKTSATSGIDGAPLVEESGGFLILPLILRLRLLQEKNHLRLRVQANTELWSARLFLL